jgi:hypothetical protein
MKKSMLDYCKLILSKVSFDKRLLRKEYRKSITILDISERYHLKQWLRKEILRQT